MISPKDKPKKKPPKDSLTLLPCFYFVELPIVASSMVSLYFLELTDLLRPAQVGFRCHDRALSMPYVESGDELIPLLMLLSLAFAGPAASIMLGEGLVYCLQSRLKLRPKAEGSINAGGCNFNSFLRRTVRFVGVHMFGLCATALVTDVIQLATGYHAPFFLTVCKPNYTLPGVSCDTNPYITQDICSGPDQHAILSARKTFPSQHATLSAFAAVYVSMYFNSTISDSTKLLKPLLVFAFAIAAGLCGLTQITQYRSHPIDVYVGFLIGAGIATYLAFHAVGNFKSSEDSSLPAPRPQAKDALRALTQRGHDSVYQKNHPSESTDELAAPQRMEGINRQVQREKASLGSLKRASVDVELLAPRSPMGKENMVTFSNTLPRVNTPNVDDPARRHMTIHVPLDPLRSKQLVSEWKQKSMELRSVGLNLGAEEEEEDKDDSEEESESGDEVDEEDLVVPSSLYPTVQARANNTGARVVIPPRPGPPLLVHIPEEPPPTSPKGCSGARAKWLSIAEKSSGGIIPVPTPSALRAANQPRIMQVIALSKQQGMICVTPKHSEASSSTSSSSDSPLYKTPSERDSGSIVTVDAHAAHHPIVHVSSGNGGVGPWEWKQSANTSSNGSAPEIRESHELNDLNRECSRNYRPVKSASPGSSASDPDQDLTVSFSESRSREATLRRKPGVGVLAPEREGTPPQTEQDPFYRKLQAGRRFKD
ncbi:phospholipid phosphatase-related protein type 3 [Erpetoichthys calabaricus]|uniref:Phospholipid phosphatase-related protein type 3 n=1 Tax=Erpetoichthys calabaricus TaxID=27687 RepID=A0A8C4TT62_ERPCA|nr:phospholipid phosphatase-related protein type 3 [Erpetoichthys calabaricus]